MSTSRVGIALFLLILLNLVAAAGATHPQRGAGKVRRPPTYLYQVTKRDKGRMRFGFIDRTGKLVIGFDQLPETTVAVGEFHQGRAVIYLGKTKEDVYKGNMNYTVGYIDEWGKIIIAPRFDVARDFSEGLAYVEEDATGLKGFINRAGKVVIKLDGLMAKDFHDGRAAVGTIDDHKKWGYIDRAGCVVVKPQYEFADDFSEGLAGVALDGKYGFINKQGTLIISLRFAVRKELRHGGVIISSGRFSEGLACVSVADSNGYYGVYGYINKKGEFVIPAQFNYAQGFSDGLAWVVKDLEKGVASRAGWIDKTGRWVVTKIQGRTLSPDILEFYSYAGISYDWRYSEGLVPFFVYSRHINQWERAEDTVLWGYMDKRGRETIKPRVFDSVGPFKGGVARVEFINRVPAEYGYIDRQGRFIWRSTN